VSDDEIDQGAEWDRELLMAHEICAPYLLDNALFRRGILLSLGSS
jgi:hypothetical protein